ERFPLRVAAAPATVGVRGIEARVSVVGDAAALEKVPRGSIALVLSNEMKTFDDLFDEYMKNGRLLAAAEKAHVAALLLQSTHPRGLLYRHPMTLDGSISRVPPAIISRENANRLARLADQGREVRVRLDLRTQMAGPMRVENVIGEIRGREKPDEVVLLGAH